MPKIITRHIQVGTCTRCGVTNADLSLVSTDHDTRELVCNYCKKQMGTTSGKKKPRSDGGPQRRGLNELVREVSQKPGFTEAFLVELRGLVKEAQAEALVTVLPAFMTPQETAEFMEITSSRKGEAHA